MKKFCLILAVLFMAVALFPAQGMALIGAMRETGKSRELWPVRLLKLVMM